MLWSTIVVTGVTNSIIPELPTNIHWINQYRHYHPIHHPMVFRIHIHIIITSNSSINNNNTSNNRYRTSILPIMALSIRIPILCHRCTSSHTTNHRFYHQQHHRQHQRHWNIQTHNNNIDPVPGGFQQQQQQQQLHSPSRRGRFWDYPSPPLYDGSMVMIGMSWRRHHHQILL